MNIKNLTPYKPFTFEGLFELLNILSKYDGGRTCIYSIRFYSIEQVLRMSSVGFSLKELKEDVMQYMVNEEKYNATKFDIISIEYTGCQVDIKLQMLDSFFVHIEHTKEIEETQKEILKGIYKDSFTKYLNFPTINVYRKR